MTVYIVQEMRGWTEGRVNAPDTAAMRESLSDLKPGIFKTDESALATLRSIKGRMAKAYSDYAQVDATLHPNALGQYNDKEITNARVRMNSITTLMAEVHAIENSYSAYLEGLRTVSKKSTPDGVSSTRAKLKQMATENK